MLPFVSPFIPPIAPPVTYIATFPVDSVRYRGVIDCKRNINRYIQMGLTHRVAIPADLSRLYRQGRNPTPISARPAIAELPVLGRCCALCAATLSDLASPDTVCGHCLAHPPAYDRVFAAFPYTPPISDLICDLKFGKRLHCARLLAALLAARATAQSDLSLPDCLIPIPLHYTRLQQRGFNQSLEIARGLSRRLKLRLDAHCLKRIRASVPQTALPAKQRQQNPKGAFALHHAPRARFAVLVDDVMTTGATINEAARVLKKAGVERVEVWIAGRTQQRLVR